MIRNSSKSVEGKTKKEQVTLRDIHGVAEANQLKLQNLELAVANLTSICSALRNDNPSLLGSVSIKGPTRKLQARANDTISSRSSSTGSLDTKDQKLGFQIQQLVEQAAALGILKQTKTTSSTRPIKVSVLAGHMRNPRPQITRAVLKSVQPTTTQKSCTKPQIQNKESTTQKKMSTKLTTANDMTATQPKGKGSPQITVRKPATTAKVALRSTVKNTRTTISELYLESATTNKENKETSRSNISVRSSVQNVRRIGVQCNGSLKLRTKADQGDKSETATISHDLKLASSSPRAAMTAKPDVKPRRRWSTSKEIVL